MAVNDVYVATLYQEVLGIQCANVFHWQETAEPTGNTMEETINAWYKDEVVPVMAANLCDDWKAVCVTTRKVGGGSPIPYHLVFSTNNTGTQSGTTMPVNVVACISFYGGYTKETRGRCYISGWCAEDEDDNCWTSAAFDRLGNIADVVRDPIVTGGLGGGAGVRVVLGGNPAFPYPVIKSERRSQVRKLRSRTARRCG